MNTAELLVSQARQGRFRTTLPALLDLATSQDGSRDQAWEAAAAAIQIMFWEDRFTDAADLAADLIGRDGSLGGSLCDQDIPFDEAFLACEVHTGRPAAPRLREAASRVPAGRNLSDQLVWLADAVAERPVVELLPNFTDWAGPVLPAEGLAGADLLDRDFASLASKEKHRLWQVLMKTNDFARAQAIVAASGEAPDDFAVTVWLAGWFAAEGDIAHGERMLLTAHGQWWPYMKWDAIPSVPVLQPTLRLVTTDRVREYYLTRPIGPEAEKNA